MFKGHVVHHLLVPDTIQMSILGLRNWSCYTNIPLRLHAIDPLYSTDYTLHVSSNTKSIPIIHMLCFTICRLVNYTYQVHEMSA